VALALVGAVPPALVALSRTTTVRDRAAAFVSTVLREELGLEATFSVEVVPLPPAIVVTSLRVPSTDGGSDAVNVPRLVVAPRLLPLLDGRLDVGDVTVEQPRVRVVLRDGKPVSFALRPPATSAASEGPTEIPLRSLRLIGGDVEIASLDHEVSARLRELSLDAHVYPVGGVLARPAGREGASRGSLVRATLLAGVSQVVRSRRVAGALVVDDDQICSLSLSAEIAPRSIVVKNASLVARLDADALPGTLPSCTADADPEVRLSLALADLKVLFDPAGAPGTLPSVTGHVELDAPVRVAHRIAEGIPSLVGAVGLDVDVAYQPSHPLPDATGKLRLREVVLDGKRTLSHVTDAELTVKDGVVSLPTVVATYADADVTIKNVVARVLEPGIPVSIDEIEIQHLAFSGLMRDLGVSQHTHVQWHLDHGTARNFSGHAFDPVRKGPVLMSEVDLHTSGFVLYDRGFDHPKKSRIVSVAKAHARGRWGFEPNGCVFRQVVADTGASHLVVPSILVGFEDAVEVVVGEGTRVDLAEISPLVSVPLAGKVEAKGRVYGAQSDPRIEGEAKATSLVLAGLPVADSLSIEVTARPNLAQADFTEGHGTKGKSAYDIPQLHLDVGRPGGGALVEGTAEGKGLDVRDLLAIAEKERDPRLTEVKGTVDVRTSLRLDMGGVGDVCGGGFVEAHASATLGKMEVYGETYDGGQAEMDFTWRDRLADERGVEATIRSLFVRKGRGTITGSGSVSAGGVLAGSFLASDIPLTRVDTLAWLPRGVDGAIDASGTLGGFLDAWSAEADVRVTPLRMGRRALPASRLHASIVPRARPPETGHKTRCGNTVPPLFDPKVFARDEAAGAYVTNGELFGGQVHLDNVQTSRQRAKVVKGVVRFDRLDLGTASELLPPVLLGDTPTQGAVSGTLTLGALPLDHPEKADVRLALSSLDVTRDGQHVRLRDREASAPLPELRVVDDALSVASFGVVVAARSGLTAEVELSGGIKRLGTDRVADLHATLAPTDLSSLAGLLPGVDAASGSVEATFDFVGPLAKASPTGTVKIRGASVKLRGAPAAMDNLELELRIDEREARVKNATASLGGGKLSFSARAPLRDLSVGVITGTADLSDVRLPLAEGVDATIDASVGGAWMPPTLSDPTFHKAKVSGDVSLTRFLYTKPSQISAGIDSLGKAKRQSVRLYDPSRDLVDVDIDIRAKRPLIFRNNIVEASVVLDSDSLNLTGTNQRFGVRGALRVEKGGHLRLRANDFEIQKGIIRFEDPTHVAPRVDLLATTDYRRYTSAGGAASGSARAGGAWRVSMHAYGDPDELKVDLTSEPGLAQEDLVLLLTIGMTRAELDQLQAGNLGATAALEALSALSGASSAVTSAVPIIDDFRFGSAYSARTGRTEPTVTVGKRISEDVRANVMTGLTENREMRSYLEWRLGPKTSVIGNYDNLNDVTSQGLGNLGSDFRVRVEF
jgi:translocation and assembly module TamB